MRILIYTDNHFCSNSSIVRSKGQKYSARLENQIETLNWINDIALEKNCDKMICLGDFFDSATLNAEELTALKEVKWNNLPKEFLVGNHEMGNNDLSYNSTNALSQYGKVIDKPTIDCGFGYEILYLPYMLESNRKPLSEIIEETTKEYYTGMFTTQEVKERSILSHNDLKGIRYGQYESKQGFDIDEIEKECSLFVNGHLHNGQWMTKKILNLGNCTGLNFTEDGFKYKHQIAILDTSTLKVELIENPYAFYFYQIDSFKALQDHINEFSDKYTIATIKVPENVLNQVRDICDKHFKAYRLLLDTTKEKNEQKDIKQLLKNDYITEFSNCCLENIDNNEILKEEIGLLSQE